jgi:hypothetical protein
MNHEVRESPEELEGPGGFALLGRKAGPSLDVLAYDAGEGKVLCIFETQKLADAFSRVSPEVRGQGWQVHVMTVEKLPELLESFDYVTINPSPGRGSQKELVSASGFARSLQHRGIEQ